MWSFLPNWFWPASSSSLLLNAGFKDKLQFHLQLQGVNASFSFLVNSEVRQASGKPLSFVQGTTLKEPLLLNQNHTSPPLPWGQNRRSFVSVILNLGFTLWFPEECLKISLLGPYPRPIQSESFGGRISIFTALQVILCAAKVETSGVCGCEHCSRLLYRREFFFAAAFKQIFVDSWA